ncbi:MAG: class I SAM-dependent methyltransferase [Lachnospiraceae bacterium]|nr:class I SAM-dependent methyltransferase [Lachnospiraceae bacterium]
MATDVNVGYYDKHASEFIEATVDARVDALYARFRALIPAGGDILDLGCGSGRDSRYFASEGYRVVAADPSEAMCEYARAYAQVEVRQLGAQELSYDCEFDGVWACSSLLHVPETEMALALQRVWRALRPGGVLYASWKYGRGKCVRGERTFTDMDEESLRSVLAQVPGLQAVSIWVTEDVRPDRSDRWLNALTRKVASFEYSTK